jgi:hypothetical protein
MDFLREVGSGNGISVMGVITPDGSLPSALSPLIQNLTLDIHW